MPKITQYEFSKRCGVNDGTISNLSAKGKLIKVDGLLDTENELNASYINQHTKKNNGSNEFTKLKKQLAEADLAKKLRDIELADLKIAKTMGTHLPVDLVIPVFKQHSKSMTNAFYTASENIVLEMVKIAGLNRKQKAEMQKRVTEEVNKAAETAINNSVLQLDNIISDFSKTKSVGERD